MKIDTSKLIKKATSNTKLDLSKLSNKQEEEKKQNINLSFRHLNEEKPKEEIKPVETNESKPLKLAGMAPQGRALFRSIPKPEVPKEQGFSLTFTDKKVYSLDTIVRDKRRDNANCPLILKVNLENENDKEITELVTILIIDDYLNAGKTESDPDYLDYETIKNNYPNLVHEVPSFYTVFDEYFNKYYGYYWNQIHSQSYKEGSISLDSIKEIIVDSYINHYDNLLGETMNEYANVLAFNKPRVEYEMGTEQGPDDKPIDTSFLNLAVQDNKLYIKDKDGIIPGQTGIPFSTINNELILNNNKNFQLLSLNDYIELIQNTILLVKPENGGFIYQGILTSDNKCLSAVQNK